MGGLFVVDEDVVEVVSGMCHLGRLEGVTGVTLRVWVVVVFSDSALDDTLGAEEDV